jgi:hypothetical protein
MRRLSSTTAVVIVLTSALCWGQRGGGMHGGAGFASRGGMGAGGFHGGASHFAGRGFHGGPHSGFHSGNGFHHPGHGPRIIIRNPRFNDRFRAGFYSPYPYYYSPFWWDWADSSYDSQADNSYAQYQSNAEINRLSDEVQELREEQRERQYESSSMRPPAPQPKTEAKQQEDLPVVLVFLDKRIQEVKNYAVANEMLIVLEGNRRRKYPLADIDLAATMKLNDERGVNFEVPNPVMTQ